VSAELEVLQDAVARLEGAGIAYMLTGSVALSYYAEPRMTRDVDLVVELAGLEPRSIVAVRHGLLHFGSRRRTRDHCAHDVQRPALEKVVKLDFIVRKDTPYRRREFERRKRVQMPGFEAWIVSREDLILSKLAWAKESGSELQLRDVGALLAGGADEAYLRSCAEELAVAALLESRLNGRHDS
jgi:Nucleotidyl transferase AbiEii toxin, Type IV TA system